MKLRSIAVQNLRSFLGRAELRVDGDMAVLVGPNGGGKTNLLDTLTATIRGFLLRPYTVPMEGNPVRPTFKMAEAFAAETFERHSSAPSADSIIDLEVAITQQDIDTMVSLKAMEGALKRHLLENGYRGLSTQLLNDLDPSIFKAGDTFKYQVINNSMPTSAGLAGDQYREYLGRLEAFAQLKARIDQRPLALPFAYFPVNRGLNDIPSSIAIASFNEADAKQSVDRNWSRQVSSIQHLALGRIFQQKRMSLEPAGSVFRIEFDADGALKRLGETLKSLGYDWRIDTVNPQNNEYELRLIKNGRDFNISRASSGEKELLTYVLAVYGLNLRDALIIVDEPELHLHPRWQKALLELFERLTRETGNQFVTATHSPSFISPTSIAYVSRVFVKDDASEVVKLSNQSLPNQKHLLSIVNSQNNEKIFFADKVVLVEGLSDRIFFERLIASKPKGSAKDQLIEVVSVGGKSLFGQYAALLDSCGVAHCRIADLDYVTDLDGGLSHLFKPDTKSIKASLADATSMDGAALFAAMESAIASGSVAELRPVWDYVKQRRQRLRKNLDKDEKKKLSDFIEARRSDGVYILSRGALEAYLPEGHARKDIEKLITLLSSPDFWRKVPSAGKDELEQIVDCIIR